MRNKFGSTLMDARPDLATEWHPYKNGILTPKDVLTSSNKVVWWQIKAPHPETGEIWELEWQASIKSRVNGRQCPFLVGKAILKGFNDFESLRPEIAKEWHPYKNGNLKPSDVSVFANKKVWWQVAARHPITGDTVYLEWEAKISKRSAGQKCPYLSGRGILPGFNDLKTLRPDIAAELHPYKNGNITPEKLTIQSARKVWWQIKAPHPITGEIWTLEWQARVADRVAGIGCPYISGKKILVGFNDLESVMPEIAKEWHPTLNGDLTPKDVVKHSNKKIWWIYKYKDLVTNEDREYIWRASPNNRSKNACPLLVKHLHTSFAEQAIYFYIKQLYPNALNGYKDIFTSHKTELDIYIPELSLGIEYDGAFWHKTTSSQYKDTKKYEFCKSKNIYLIRVLEWHDEYVSNRCDHYIIRKNLNTTSDLDNTINKLLSFINTYASNGDTTIIDSISVDTARDMDLIRSQYIAVA